MIVVMYPVEWPGLLCGVWRSFILLRSERRAQTRTCSSWSSGVCAAPQWPLYLTLQVSWSLFMDLSLFWLRSEGNRGCLIEFDSRYYLTEAGMCLICLISSRALTWPKPPCHMEPRDGNNKQIN